MKKERQNSVRERKRKLPVIKIRELQKLYKSFFDDAPIGKAMVSPDGLILRANAAFCEMLGYTQDELRGMHVARITHRDDVAATMAGVEREIAGAMDVWIFDKRYITKDGSIVWGRVTTRLHRDAAGKPVVILTHVQDITAIRAAEKRRSRAEQRLRRFTIPA